MNNEAWRIKHEVTNFIQCAPGGGVTCSPQIPIRGMLSGVCEAKTETMKQAMRIGKDCNGMA